MKAVTLAFLAVFGLFGSSSSHPVIASSESLDFWIATHHNESSADTNLERRALMNMKKVDENADRRRLKDFLTRTQREAVTLARAALEEIKSGETRLLKMYFSDDDAIVQRVHQVYKRIAGDDNDDETGSKLLSEIRPVPRDYGDNRSPCDDPATLASMISAKMTIEKDKDKVAPLVLCPLLIFGNVLPSLGEVTELCLKNKPKKMSYAMNNAAGIILHEWTHYDPIGMTNGEPVIDIDKKTRKSYGLNKARKMAQPGIAACFGSGTNCAEKAVRNADNYNWFAMQAYMERACANGGKRLRLS